MSKTLRKNKNSKKNVKHYSKNNKSNKSNKMRGSGGKSMINSISGLFSFTKPITDDDFKKTGSINIIDGVMKIGDKTKKINQANIVDEILQALDKSKKTLMSFSIYNTISEQNKISEQELILIIGALLKNEVLTKITIHDYHISMRVAKMLSEFLKVNTLTSLILNNNKMNSDGMVALVEGLSHINTLKTLDIGSNNIGDDGIVALSEVLNHTNITQLNIDNCKLDSNEKNVNNYGIETLSKVLQTNKKLEMLTISNNNIGCFNILNLLSSLENHVKLTMLDISNTNMTKNCKDKNLPFVIGEAISQIKNLNVLNMADNSIGNNDMSKIFSSLVGDNSSNIKHMIISNNNLGKFNEYNYDSNNMNNNILLDKIIYRCNYETLIIDNNPFTKDDKNRIQTALENNDTITDMGESLNKKISNLLFKNKNFDLKPYDNLTPTEKLEYSIRQNKLAKKLSEELKLLRNELKEHNIHSNSNNSNSNNSNSNNSNSNNNRHTK